MHYSGGLCKVRYASAGPTNHGIQRPSRLWIPIKRTLFYSCRVIFPLATAGIEFG